jgi:hypothetical protein
MKLQQQISQNKSVLLFIIYFFYFLNPNFNPSLAACPVAHLPITIRKKRKRERTERNGDWKFGTATLPT